eukprot:Skav221632  [mRNA]  locus=scaffold2627:268016:268216:- [translate_table: standard]
MSSWQIEQASSGSMSAGLAGCRMPFTVSSMWHRFEASLKSFCCSTERSVLINMSTDCALRNTSSII